ncbi:hypothetical protein B0H10DRAFT_1955179 [Mycena sp. CBHHK59/15]|nr:hypothetical protein B0H10DRAFT_1955179 [Mycena sp. CBHHK59/15]
MSLEIPCAAQGFAFTTQHKILLFILGFAAVNLRSKIWTELSCLCSRVTHPPLPSYLSEPNSRGARFGGLAFVATSLKRSERGRGQYRISSACSLVTFSYSSIFVCDPARVLLDRHQDNDGAKDRNNFVLLLCLPSPKREGSSAIFFGGGNTWVPEKGALPTRQLELLAKACGITITGLVIWASPWK